MVHPMASFEYRGDSTRVVWRRPGESRKQYATFPTRSGIANLAYFVVNEANGDLTADELRRRLTGTAMDPYMWETGLRKMADLIKLRDAGADQLRTGLIEIWEMLTGTKSAAGFTELFHPRDLEVDWGLTPRSAEQLRDALRLISDELYSEVEEIGNEPVTEETSHKSLTLS